MASLSDLLLGPTNGQANAAPSANPLFNVTPVAAQAPADTYSTDPQTLVQQMYQQYLGRAPDPSGNANWMQQVANGMQTSQLIQAFKNSSEYANVHPKQAAQNAWLQQARAATQGINAEPFVNNPSTLSTDPAANMANMYKAPANPATGSGTQTAATDPAALQQQIQALLPILSQLGYTVNPPAGSSQSGQSASVPSIFGQIDPSRQITQMPAQLNGGVNDTMGANGASFAKLLGPALGAGN